MNRANIEGLKYADLLALQAQIEDAIAVRKAEDKAEHQAFYQFYAK